MFLRHHSGYLQNIRSNENMTRKKKQNSKSNRLMSILTFVSLILIIWEMFIFRKTFINIFMPLSIFLIGGPILFFILRKKIKYYIETEHGLFSQAFHGTVLFGGTLMFIFMFLNYYLPVNKTELIQLKVIETGNLSSRRGCDAPFAKVDYYGFEKQLIFPCNTNLSGANFIKVKLQKGLFGFMVVKDSKLEKSRQSEPYSIIDTDFEKQYVKILVRAEEYYNEGNIEKSIELYERAVRLKPTDKLAKIRLKEIKNTSNSHHAPAQDLSSQ